MRLSTQKVLPGNGFKSKFERMNLILTSTSNPQPHRCVAYLQNEDFPDTVLLFELGCAHPAPRVMNNTEMAFK